MPGVFTVTSGGILRLHGGETVTTPTISAGSLVDYYGPSTYTSLAAGTSYSNIKFTAGTYNLTSNLNISANFTNSGAVFNQTSNTTTFTGTTNVITGNNTFYNLAKTVVAPSTLTSNSLKHPYSLW